MKLNFVIQGNGPDLLLLHGWSGSIRTISPLASALAAKGYRVTSLEWPGCGDSSVPDQTLHLGDYVRLLAASLEELNLTNPVVIGHSFGGKVILKTLLHDPQAFERIVLISAAGIKPRNNIKKAIFKSIAKTAGKVADLPLINKFKDQLEYGYYRYIVRELDYFKSKPMRETFKNVIAEDFDEKLSVIKVPALIIWGKQDKITPLWMGQKMHDLISGSRLEIVEGYGHGLPLVNPQKVADLIYNYLHS